MYSFNDARPCWPKHFGGLRSFGETYGGREGMSEPAATMHEVALRRQERRRFAGKRDWLFLLVNDMAYDDMPHIVLGVACIPAARLRFCRTFQAARYPQAGLGAPAISID
eukprot:GHVU01007725.1.p1 GENE.GHVU01007725.1~~GHVU01007725.1.p1  ORF type:complete len:110 (+),score=7.93 GHVU01007725.1:261-590(+)